MSAHWTEERLVEAALDSLELAERRSLEAHLAGCTACSAELVAARDAMSMMGAVAAPIAPAERARAQFFERIEGTARYLPFTDRVAKLYDLAPSAAEALLARLHDARAFAPCPFAGVSLRMVEAGAASGAHSTFFARFEPGTRFPTHRHLGVERVLVLEGAYTESDGVCVRAGDLAVSADATAHSFDVSTDGPCIAALAIERGFTIVEGA